MVAGGLPPPRTLLPVRRSSASAFSRQEILEALQEAASARLTGNEMNDIQTEDLGVYSTQLFGWKGNYRRHVLSCMVARTLDGGKLGWQLTRAPLTPRAWLRSEHYERGMDAPVAALPADPPTEDVPVPAHLGAEVVRAMDHTLRDFHLQRRARPFGLVLHLSDA